MNRTLFLRECRDDSSVDVEDESAATVTPNFADEESDMDEARELVRNLDMPTIFRGKNAREERGVEGAVEVAVDPERDAVDAVCGTGVVGEAEPLVSRAPGARREERGGGGGGGRTGEAERLECAYGRREYAPCIRGTCVAGPAGRDCDAPSGRMCGVRERCRPMAICSGVGRVSGSS